MHELGIAQEIVRTVAEATGPGRVRRIVLEIGALSLVLPDALRFCFDLAAAETSLAGAELAIVETPGRARCRACGGEVTLQRPFGRCACGESDLDWLSGDELTINGQKGIQNNVSVDGADFNNPFFGEQRGGQRPAFTFNLDAVKEVVVVAEGANAEFGRSNGGFVNVVTKSGTNDTHGTAHFYFKDDALSSPPKDRDGNEVEKLPFSQQQLGFTLGSVWAPAAYTFLAMEWGTPGWLVIAAIVVVAAIAIHPAARAAERHLARQSVPAPS